MLRASANSIKFSSIYNHQDIDSLALKRAPYAYFLEIDDICFLLDCGWDEKFSPHYLEQLLPYIKKADAVLLSSPELISCGALPFVKEHSRQETLLVAAGSTAKMGLHGTLHPFLYQYPNMKQLVVNRDITFDLTVDKIYSTFRNLREPSGGKFVVGSKDMEVECFPSFCGRMLGGYAWTMKYQIDELLYCPDFTTRQSLALRRFNIPATAQIVLLNTSFSHSTFVKKYDEQLQNLTRDILNALRMGSDVLVPVDASGRGLEILVIIRDMLRVKGATNYKVIFASLQAPEILAKAATMTEALLDKVILGDQQIFSDIITCRSAEEVMQIQEPKVCVAEGEGMDFGISSQLLPSFLESGGNSLIVLTSPPHPESNASKVANAQPGSSLSVSFFKRSRLSKEELEEYYIKKEREEEEEEMKRREEAKSRLLEDNMSYISDEDNVLPQEKKERTAAPSPRGLYLPGPSPYICQHLHFPVEETGYCISASVLNGVDVSYGLPVSDTEQSEIRKKAPIRIFSDEGPDGFSGPNDAQSEANLPFKITFHKLECTKKCRAVFHDLSGCPDSSALRAVLQSKFSFAKKIVSLRCSSDDWRSLSQHCRTEKSLKCGENVFFPPKGDIPIELATKIFSYSVQVDPAVANTFQRNMKRVIDKNMDVTWDVCWVNGELKRAYGGVASEENNQKKQRTEEAFPRSIYILKEVEESKLQLAAKKREKNGHQGKSFFLGEVDLVKMRDHLRSDSQYGLSCDFPQKMPMLVFDEGACVRKSADGAVTISSVASPALYDVRRTVYNQFSQVL